MTDIGVKEAVKEKYGQAALRVRSPGGSCCSVPPRSHLVRSL
jgi:hypothetical protein